MTQEKTWEKEYKNSKLITKKENPQKDVLRFLKYYKKTKNTELKNLKILDLGSGTGRNTNYLASLGNEVIGLEIAPTAVNLAKERAKNINLKIDYRIFNIGSEYPFEDNFFDLIFDITSSNSLNEKERKIYLSEVARVIKKDGYFFIKTLCRDGDKNAKALLKNFPGKEYDTYVMKKVNLTERVFSETNFKKIYSKYFNIIRLIKKTSYTRFNGQSYKRNFWLAYMRK
ncbi:class I SAM-dependent methyltransferase [bacterium]|nr:class I SAM-dependent methyltransferase [bacterium]